MDAFEVKDGSEFGAVSIQVKDSGVGIAKENLHKVFNEIVQFDANKNQGGGGSGIGLWISKKIVDLHGGTVRVHSEGIGHGCIFEIRIPITAEAKAFRVRNRRTLGSIIVHRKEDEQRSAESINSSQIRGHPSTDGDLNVEPAKVLQRMIDGRCTIKGLRGELPQLNCLVVDDSKLNRKFMIRLLLLSNLSADEASDGNDCVTKVTNSLSTDDSQYDIVFMDNRMPGMDGVSATEELRRLGYMGIVIGVTGDGQPEDISGFKEAGADDVLIKPITNDQLVACMHDCLQRRRRGKSFMIRERGQK